jgi:ubiquinone/menaquinone biosynthesis C-methylase UbiE
MNVMDCRQTEHHNKHYQNILKGGYGNYDGFINPNSIWYWMHTYCLEQLGYFFSKIPASYFLTVGDGYCGREAGFVKRYGHKVHASDMETCLIEVAKDWGVIDECSQQDMNKLSFADDTFDYALVKESLHHLSKPYQGLYEMMRVSKKGIILIEPNGDNERKYAFSSFEETGNYCFAFSSHELIKVGLSMGCRYYLVTYSIQFFGQHNDANIAAGKVEEEKSRLKELDSKLPLPHKPLLICIFLKNKEDYDRLKDGLPHHIVPVEIRGNGATQVVFGNQPPGTPFYFPSQL